jgi:uncharacterized protein (UPF0332 family)
MLQKLEKYADNLENLVQQRTAELEDEKLKTEKLLYRMLPALVPLFYSVFHTAKVLFPVRKKNVVPRLCSVRDFLFTFDSKLRELLL